MEIKRLLFIGACLLLLVILVAFGYIKNPAITLSMCLENPAHFDHQIVELGNEATIARLWDGGFTLRQMGLEIPVYGHHSELALNDYVYLKAVFHQEGHLELVSLRVAKMRRAKIWTSVPPMMLILGMFFFRYRFDFRHFQFTERKKCRI